MTTDYLISHRSEDGIRLALDFHNRCPNACQRLLIVAPGADPASALSLGLDPNHNSLLSFVAGEDVSPIRGTDNVSVVSDWGQQPRCAEILTKILSQDYESRRYRILPLLLLERLEHDLPSLSENCRLTFFWSDADMLSKSHLELFEYASERLETENPSLGGFVLYDLEDTNSHDRATTIQDIFRPHFNMERRTLPKGTPWQQQSL